MRITNAMVEEIERLLAQGQTSQRKIALTIGVSRSTVNNIYHGRRPRCDALSESLLHLSGPLERCPGCGGRVYMPCVLCHVRQLKARDRRLGDPRHAA